MLGCGSQTSSEFERLRSSSNKVQRVSQQQSISEKLGTVPCADGRSAIVYRALRNLFCSRCSQVIAATDLFTRWSVRHSATLDDATTNDGSPLLAARCRECVPFDFEIAVNSESVLLQTTVAETHETSVVTAQPVRSKLLEHLLSPPTQRRSANETMLTPEKVSCAAPVATHRLVKPETAVRITVVEKVECAESVEESFSSTAAEASYNRLAPALNSRSLRAANRRPAWRNKK